MSSNRQDVELTLNYSTDVIEAARNMDMRTHNNVLNVDLRQKALKYKRMAPRIIAARLKRVITDERKAKLDASKRADLDSLQEEMLIAAEDNVTTGMFRMINLSTIQSDGTTDALLIAYGLYEWNGKAVCDMVFIDASQKTSYSKAYLGGIGLKFLQSAVAGMVDDALAVVEIYAALAAFATVAMNSNAEALLLKTLKDYGFVEFVGDNKIKLIAD